jgi:hypothetical protein
MGGGVVNGSMMSGIALDHGSSIPRPPVLSGIYEMSRAWWGVLCRVKSVARKDLMISSVAEVRGLFQSVQIGGGFDML